MALSPLRIDFVSIQTKRLAFDPAQKKAQIEALAYTIADLGGLIDIPVVRQLTIDEYELLSGYLEYYAYRKAREINPHLSEQIEVFVADSRNQSLIQKQLEILQSIEETKAVHPSKLTSGNPSEVDLRIKNIESSIYNNQRATVDAIAQLKVELLQEITRKLPKPIPPLEAFNRISEPEVAHKVHRKIGSGAKAVVELLQERSRDRKHKPFKSFSEVLDALQVTQKTGKGKGKLKRLISEKRMLEIIDNWNE